MTKAIVIVDDDPIIRMDIREMLEEEGYLVTGEGKNGQEAIELVARLKPDLVIMDVKMPIMNGIKAAQIIHKMQQDTCVLLLTAYSQKELVQDARSSGVAAYLVKPITEADLIPAVEIALSQKEKMDSLKKDIVQLKQFLEERKLVEKAKGVLMRVYAIDEEEAYRRLRDASMSTCTPLSKLAACILADGPELMTEILQNR
ncbi:response regulator receiver and ANTAR domain protein [Paenibacillus sp. yr247]|uniref:ANTAR domain-containing response regulator n=1 Tax=Paenibacillus sp. yr247 TaxID=1761880 RepID=UPI000891E8D0|nr:response regulator [Paenibacillus sp. yr247]SDN68823.1 response regulator receiver and ANTAR domain protein [Paenibacillus sp. yr247]